MIPSFFLCTPIQDRVTEISRTSNKVTSNHAYTEGILTVRNAQAQDSGVYTCKVTDHNWNKNKESYEMMIIKDEGQSYIQLMERNNYTNVGAEAKKTVSLAVQYKGYPHPTLQWYKPDGTEIPHGISFSGKYNLTTLDDKSTLYIFNTSILNSGIYTLKASNGAVLKKLDFKVTIFDKPVVAIDDVYVQAGEKAHVQCRVKSHIKPIVTWVFQPCSIEPRWPSCGKSIIQDFNVSIFGGL